MNLKHASFWSRWPEPEKRLRFEMKLILAVRKNPLVRSVTMSLGWTLPLALILFSVSDLKIQVDNSWDLHSVNAHSGGFAMKRIGLVVGTVVAVIAAGLSP